MKKYILFCMLWAILFGSLHGQAWIRINQLGYLPGTPKIAVFITNQEVVPDSFHIMNALDQTVVFDGKSTEFPGQKWGMRSTAQFDFSAFDQAGGYYIQAGKFRSPCFRISQDVYQGTADFILQYMRQQRCGFNPFLKDSCHTHDGFVVDYPGRTGEIIDVKGGWHDATDYLQYVTTSANAVYQMLYAYSRNPEVYGDCFLANGLPGKNGIPDILDEARWGLDWLLKMNPDSGVMFNQIADDRDHQGFRLPNHDSASYGNGLYRPVYYLTGKPQGLGAFKNRATGVASAAGKYTAAFALAAQIFRKSDPAFSSRLAVRARQDFSSGLADPGVAQTACVVSPYFYEEDNYSDDLELAAIELFKLTGEQKYYNQAVYWGELEHSSPWMGSDTARHYQYYPFINLGHANLSGKDSREGAKFQYYMRLGLTKIRKKALQDPFQMGIPFVWCSNNFVVATLTQARIYAQLSGDTSFLKMEAALRDWLFGCNPWGTSMICGLPEGGDYPANPHSSIRSILHINTTGGLVDGPVYNTIYKNLKGLTLFEPDPYVFFQQGLAVYHDDMGDYSTNEPTMDGTASLSFYLSSLEHVPTFAENKTVVKDATGAIIRTNTDLKEIHLIFSADTFKEGFPEILSTLKRKNIKASFFLTGNFLRNPENESLIRQMIQADHYVGGHSDRHLLYCSWENQDSLLVTRDSFERDLRMNFKELARYGITRQKASVFLPPYEWCNTAIYRWATDLDLTLINLTPGSATQADYTTPDMKNYLSSGDLISRLNRFEASAKDHLQGAIILIHPGTDPSRTDKLYMHLGEIIDSLRKQGYSFSRF